MKIECPCCQEKIEIDDVDVRAYVARLDAKAKSTAKSAAAKINGSKPRPGSLGNTRAKRRPVETNNVAI